MSRIVSIEDLQQMSGIQIYKLAAYLSNWLGDGGYVIKAGEKKDIVQMLCESLSYFKHDPAQLRAREGYEMDVCKVVVGKVKKELMSHFMTNSSPAEDTQALVESIPAYQDDDEDDKEGWEEKTLADIPGLTDWHKVVLSHDTVSNNPHSAVTKSLAEKYKISERSIRNDRVEAHQIIIDFAKSVGVLLEDKFFYKVTDPKIVHEKKETNADFQRRMLAKSSSNPLSFNGLRTCGIR